MHTTANAAPRILSSSELRSTKVSFTDGSKNKSKLVYCNGKTPGDAKAVSNGLLFTAYSETIAKLKKNPAQTIKLLTYQRLSSAARKACARLASGQQTPVPTVAPTAVPTPVVVGYFDSAGNVTAQGKAVFGIPSSLTGNLSIGGSIVRSSCSCHGEYQGLTFPVLRTAIVKAPMYFSQTEIDDSKLASITAYLNRYTAP